MSNRHYTQEPWVPYVINDNGDWSFQIRTKRPHNPAGKVGVHIAEINGYIPTRHEIVALIARAPDLYRTSLAVIGDLKLFVSRQGPGPDRRLGELQEVLQAISEAPELRPDCTLGLNEDMPNSRYRRARVMISELRRLFDDAEISGQSVSEKALDLIDQIRKEVR